MQGSVPAGDAAAVAVGQVQPLATACGSTERRQYVPGVPGEATGIYAGLRRQLFLCLLRSKCVAVRQQKTQNLSMAARGAFHPLCSRAEPASSQKPAISMGGTLDSSSILPLFFLLSCHCFPSLRPPGLRRLPGVSTERQPWFDSTGLATIQTKSHFATNLFPSAVSRGFCPSAFCLSRLPLRDHPQSGFAGRARKFMQICRPWCLFIEHW